MTAATSWLSFVVGALGRWAAAIEDIATKFETVVTAATLWLVSVRSQGGLGPSCSSAFRGVMTKVMTPVALDISSF